MADHTGPIGGGKLTGPGGGKLMGTDGGKLTYQTDTGRLSRRTNPRDGGSELRTGDTDFQVYRAPATTATTTPPRPSTRPGPSPITIAVAAMLTLFMLVGAFTVLATLLNRANSSGVDSVGTDDYGTIFTDDDFMNDDPFDIDGIFTDEFVEDDDPTSCFDSVDGIWTGVWASSRGTGNGEVQVDLTSSGTAVEGQVAVNGAPILVGGSVIGEIDCRTVTLRIANPTSSGYDIIFTGRVGVDGSSMRGPYSVTTNHGQRSVIDEGMFVVDRS